MLGIMRFLNEYGFLLYSYAIPLELGSFTVITAIILSNAIVVAKNVIVVNEKNVNYINITEIITGMILLYSPYNSQSNGPDLTFTGMCC